MRIAVVTIILPLFLLAGCPWMPLKPEVVIPDGKILVRKVNIDPKLLQDCEPELAELKGIAPEDILKALAESKTIHDVCYKRLHELIGVWKQTFPADSAASAPEGPKDATVKNK